MANDMKTRRLDVGLESISRWRVGDEDHLPEAGKSAPKFLPRHRELDEILRRPSLDERLTDLLQPAQLDPDLLEPAVLSATREAARDLMETMAARVSGTEKTTLYEAVDILSEEVTLDQEVRSALASLLKG